MIYITAVRLSGGNRLEHITDLKWENRATSESGSSTRAQIVAWIDQGNEARVQVGYSESKVEVVRADPPYLRSSPNNTTVDNLLSLPRF
ncbi:MULTISPECIES: DUF3892 domain-containing protein [Myxococcus]|uniref:DUF3892 domain-containing protein n=1 Tax=Myxococcus TaxID=32 RepID=UPI0003615304|nr:MULTISPECIES: DUF3892 domain-containing protein [Myxococcus]NOJ56749.1 DUF3892 domain-containing protein [Myxococcus xanthus]QPM80021.1 DUF3892 domain-containing protein [Myxococcus xanthus]QVW69085.1 DUF3892 domain-containing protein [Myxococcus xanthus DZ2]QZZ47857.1 hypothetical protein MyxoNM_01480 [Myxococcus xanthus]UEO04787.1 DUF3892 domain-containing protein [Myxococcus xanthus DZ2]